MRLGSRTVDTIRAVGVSCCAGERKQVIGASTHKRAREMFEAATPVLEEYGAVADRDSLSWRWANGSEIRVRVSG